ncbi:MAG TPA: amidohydrolase [Candidatus Binatia bacterium]|nr:amidohydrolase [Candidatus Binatia bacterium]
MAILCENALVVTLEKEKPFLERQQILIHDGVIADIGERVGTAGLFIQERIDCSGKILMPGLINTHSHLTEILQRSFRDNVRMEIWRGYRAKTEERANLTAEEIGVAAELACAEMLKNGVTAVVDHFSTRPGLSVPKMKAIIRAFEKTGIRGVLAPSLTDQDFLQILCTSRRPYGPSQKQRAQQWQEPVLEVLDSIGGPFGISGLMLGPSSPFNCSDSLLRQIIRIAERHDLGIHTHFLETRLQQWAAAKLYPRGLAERLRRIAFFSPRLSAAHCIWLNKREMALMACSGASAIHNPASNLKLGSGVAPVVELKGEGVNVSLGTDGGDTSDSYSIFEQMRLAAFLSRLTVADPANWLTALDALRMGTINGAQAIPAWRGKIGRVKKGYRADLIILNPEIRLSPLDEVVQQLVFCEDGRSVDTVLVDGKIVVKNGCLTRMKEKDLVQKVQPISQRMRRIYGLILKDGPDEAELTLRNLYRKAFKGKSQFHGLLK